MALPLRFARLPQALATAYTVKCLWPHWYASSSAVAGAVLRPAARFDDFHSRPSRAGIVRRTKSPTKLRHRLTASLTRATIRILTTTVRLLGRRAEPSRACNQWSTTGTVGLAERSIPSARPLRRRAALALELADLIGSSRSASVAEGTAKHNGEAARLIVRR